MNRRKGTMLMELVMTMTAGSALVMLAIGTVHQTMRMSATARDRANFDRSYARLATQYRQDVQIATSLTVQSPDTLNLQLVDGDSVVYTALPGRIVRELKRRNNNRETEHEDFRFDTSARATFESAESSKLAVLKVVSETVLKDVPQKTELLAVARVGRMLALEKKRTVQP